MALFVLAVLTACGAAEEPPLARCDATCRVKGLKLTGYVVYPWLGDLWPSAVGPGGRLYFAFGDGSGLSRCLPVEMTDQPWPPRARADLPQMTVTQAYGEKNADFCGVFPCGGKDRYPLCPYTRAGLIATSGPPLRLKRCGGVEECLIARHLPSGKGMRDVKPSSLLFVGHILVMHFHEPSARPQRGFLAVSRDGGRHWREIPDSPWGADSPFRVMMFLHDGRRKRRFVYAFALSNEIDPGDLRLQPVYLARVPRRRVAAYGQWRYFAGPGPDGHPRFVADPAQAVPLSGLASMVQGGALYHRGVGRYLFFSGLCALRPRAELGLKGEGLAEAGCLFEAPAPWGPWKLSGYFHGGYIGAPVPVKTDRRELFFTAAGNTRPYALNIGRLLLRLK